MYSHTQRPARRTRGEPRTVELPAPGPVTAIKEQHRKPGRYLIEVGGVPLGPVTAEIIGARGVRVGVLLDAAALEALAESARGLACYDRALGALARRSRSTEELRRWLRQREFEAGQVDAALERLEALGLLDDAAFARGFARSRTVGRGFGARRVTAELARRGVARGVIQQVMAELAEQEGGDEQAALEAVARRRLRSVAALEPLVARRRLTGWLVRRGFGVGDVMRVVRTLLP